MLDDKNPFDSLLKSRSTISKVEITAEGKEKRDSKLIHRKKGEPQTPNMNFVGRINWLVRMISSIRLASYVSELRTHPARANLQGSDLIKLKGFEERVIALQNTASELAIEIAKWNKEKKLRKIVE